MLLFRVLIGLAVLGPALIHLVSAIKPEGAMGFSRAIDPGAVFNNTCTVGSFLYDVDNTTLGMYCNTDDVQDYAYDWTIIKLDMCIANYNGSLVPSPDGNFSDSCHNCTVTWSHVYLEGVKTTYTTTPHTWITNTITSVSTPRWDDLYLDCGGCSNEEYQTPPATLDLIKVVTNDNGTIGCHGFMGTTMHAKPDPTTKAKNTEHTSVPGL